MNSGHAGAISCSRDGACSGSGASWLVVMSQPRFRVEFSVGVSGMREEFLSGLVVALLCDFPKVNEIQHIILFFSTIPGGMWDLSSPTRD